MNRKFEFYCEVLKRTVTEYDCEKIQSGDEYFTECDDCYALQNAVAEILVPVLKQEIGEKATVELHNEYGINVIIHDNLAISVCFMPCDDTAEILIKNCISFEKSYFMGLDTVNRNQVVDEIKKWVNGEKVVIIKKGLLGGSWKEKIVDRADIRASKEKLLKGFNVKVIDNTGVYTKKEYLGQ